MHELAVCQSMLAQVEQIARSHDARAVEKIVIRVGPLSGVELPLLERAFPLARAGTLAAGAELVTETLPVRVRCRDCATESVATASRLVCGRCDSWHTELVSGRELLLARVELAT